MKLSTKGKYGLYAMYYLAQHTGDGPQPLKAVSAIGVSEDYLEQLLGNLRRAGLVTTVRGAQGGYLLGKEPQEITVGDIIDATEGPLNLSECLADESCCHKSGQKQKNSTGFYVGPPSVCFLSFLHAVHIGFPAVYVSFFSTVFC